ncbi:MAG: hypothetical protein ABIF01_02820 [Candidatus Micrarchaeota archaeon]
MNGEKPVRRIKRKPPRDAGTPSHLLAREAMISVGTPDVEPKPRTDLRIKRDSKKKPDKKHPGASNVEMPWTRRRSWY